MTVAAPELIPVLVVDDDPALIRTLGDILSLHGFLPSTAQTGRAALELTVGSHRRPSIAVVDLRLPDMNGLDLAEELHAQNTDIQVVILTGNGTLESAIRALREKNCDYLLKPVEPDLLLRTLRSAEGRWRLLQAEHKLARTNSLIQAVFNASPLPIAVLGEDLTVQLWNRAAEKVFGLSEDEVRGRPIPLAATRDAEGLLEAALRGQRLAGGDLRHCRRDGVEVDLRLSAARLGDGLSSPGGLVVMFEDTTERHRLEQLLQEAQRLDAMGRLVGGVAHDFNNLLSVILLEVESSVAEPVESNVVRQALEGIKTTANRGAALTRQLLSFAQRQPAEMALHDPNEVVVGLERMFTRLVGPMVKCRTALDPAPWSVRVDRGQLEQVLTNLVVNARDAMPAGGTVTIGTGNVSVKAGSVPGLDAGDWLLLTVTDTGIGIPEAIRDRVFEPLFTTKPRDSGTGLGLSTCHGIVERFQGLITVSSEIGEGTTFSVYLPSGQAQGPAATAGQTAETTGGTETILLVDDQPQVRAVARMTLTQRGYQVHPAATGAEAIETVAAMKRAPDLLVTDAELPDMDGFELIRILRQTHPGLRALITSGTTGVDSHGVAHAFLQKPYGVDRLAREVRTILDAEE